MSTKLPFISILVMSYNQEAYIGDCVDSVLSQEYDGELEFIFCDDNSSDSTFNIIQEKVYKYTGTRRIITHRNTQNQRVAANMNKGLELASGDWIMRMDGDDIMHKDRVSLSAEAIKRYPNATAICGRYKYFSGDNVPVVQNPALHELSFTVNNHLDFSRGIKPAELEWWGGIMCIKRSVFDYFGPMPPECDVLDDTMFATRSLMLGDFVSMTNAIMIYYRRHENNVSSQKLAASTLRGLLESDYKMRNYYQRGVKCHYPILREIQEFSETHPDFLPLYRYFEHHFKELKRQAFFWKKSWKERINDAHISGPFWRKIPWAIRVLCPFTYALAAKIMKKS